MYLSGVLELSDVIPFTEWMDLQGRLRHMKQIAGVLNYYMRGWVEKHTERMKIKGQGSDFMDMMLSLLERDGMLHGYKTEDIVKATVLNLISAGVHSSSVTMTWALPLLLAKP
ncbi:hypothetical protein RJ639_039773 [Escallonia herrerae]|uniref:Cytochrome P450 n=1 Tax=Escallonia herrerae TaxID=1293975 RepID=A0AA89B4S1_9ASTE|nr:hypothetical protein RJ639_039773 [Escallonia herrerae]